MKHTIYIPSAGRWFRQTTLERFPGALRAMTCLVVPEDQVKKYRRFGYGVDIVGCPEKTIGHTRQWIIDETSRKHILMFDDDMYFYKRDEPGSIKLHKCDKKELVEMVDSMLQSMKEHKYVHVSIGKRTEASFHLCRYRLVSRANNAHGFNADLLKKLRPAGVRFDRIKLMEDFHVTLSLLERGYPNKVFLDYVWNQVGSNSKGGCSTYRDLKTQAESANFLKKLHPDVVKVITKVAKAETEWKGMKERTDVRISWRKAYTGPTLKHWEVERRSTRK